MSATRTQTATRATLTVSSEQLISDSASKPETTSSKEPQKDEDLDIYDEIEIEDMTYDETLQIYHYPCPCGDRFEINMDSLRDGEDIAVCPSCSLMIRVIFDADDLPKKAGEKNGKEG